MIRHATVEDASRIAAIQVAAWRAAYRGIVPEEYLRGLQVESREAVWRRFADDTRSPILVAHLDHEMTGFCHVSPSRDEDTSDAAEIIAIYIDPPHWRKGWGRVLCSSALSFANDRGFRLVTLWTLSANRPAQRFYEAMGFRPDGASKSETMPGFTLDEVRYRIDLDRA